MDVAKAVVSSHRLGNAFNFQGILCAPLLAACLWPAEPSVLACFLSLTDLVHTFPCLSIAALIGITLEHYVLFSWWWQKDQFVEKLCHHKCSAPCEIRLVFMLDQ